MNINSGLNSTTPEEPLAVGDSVIRKNESFISPPATRDICNSHFLLSEHSTAACYC